MPETEIPLMFHGEHPERVTARGLNIGRNTRGYRRKENRRPRTEADVNHKNASLEKIGVPEGISEEAFIYLPQGMPAAAVPPLPCYTSSHPTKGQLLGIIAQVKD